MSIAVSASYKSFRQLQKGPYIREAVLTITGLTAGAANTIPHGLAINGVGKIPRVVNFVATNGVPGFQTSVADATNLYYTTGSGQTSVIANVEY
jgi:hypothetical protein